MKDSKLDLRFEAYYPHNKVRYYRRGNGNFLQWIPYNPPIFLENVIYITLFLDSEWSVNFNVTLCYRWRRALTNSIIFLFTYLLSLVKITRGCSHSCWLCGLWRSLVSFRSTSVRFTSFNHCLVLLTGSVDFKDKVKRQTNTKKHYEEI